MGLINTVKNAFSIEPKTIEASPGESIEAIFLKMSGNEITADQVKGIPMLMNCLDFIGNNVAISKIKLFKKEGDKHIETDDKRTFLLNVATGDTLTPFELKKAMVMDYFLYGSAWVYVDRNRNQVEGLYYVPNDQITLMPDTLNPLKKDFKVSCYGKIYNQYDFIRILRNTTDGYQGVSIVKDFNDFLSTSKNTQDFEGRVARSGGVKKGFLQSDHKLSEDALNNLKSAFDKLYNSNENGVIVLNEGVNFKEASATSVELQMNQNKESNRVDITNIFGLPIDFLKNMGSDEAYNNAVKTSVLPVLAAIKSSLQRDLLLSTEQEEGYYFDFDLSEILKGDTKSRYEAYDIAIKSGWMTVNEARERENFEKVDGMDVLLMTLGQVIYDTDKKIYFTPNTKESTVLE